MCDVRTVHKLHFIILISVVTYQLRSDVTKLEMVLAGLLVMLHITLRVSLMLLNKECRSAQNWLDERSATQTEIKQRILNLDRKCPQQPNKLLT